LKGNLNPPDLAGNRIEGVLKSPQVQNANANHAGVGISYTSNELATMFDGELRIDTAAFDGLSPNASHQEVDLRFNQP